ncbi:MAG: phytanoyl-CoA dioxygenase family protein [Candidatus Latescibacteria bacterium]|nr:phytanoyl-CoA dioxygenase family protein [Candidatus Latescibacterota bacterium]
MLDQRQIDQFHREGFLALRQVFGGEELELLRLAADRVQADGVAGLGQHHLYHTFPSGIKAYYRSERIWDRDPIFAAATVHPRLLEAIGQCLGHPFLPIADSFVCKTPFGRVPIPWHQDPPYTDPGQERTSAIPNFETDIYLDHSTRENGCLWGLPGHHLAGHLELERFAEEALYARAQPIEMAPGDVLFHALSAPHGSQGNTSPRTRRIFCVHYAAREVLEDGYPDWEGRKRGYGAEGLALAHRMLDLRRSLGLADPENTQVHLTEEGFTFTGQPCTPPRHWETLISQLSPEEIQRKKLLIPD